MSVRLFYVDDSGTVDTGFVTYSWVELEASRWNECLRYWIMWRRDLWQRTQVPSDYELHVSAFLNGRTSPSKDPAWNESKDNRVKVLTEAMYQVNHMPHVALGTVYRETSAMGRDYGKERNEVYEGLLQVIDQRLSDAGDQGLLFVDGDGKDPTYKRAHRRLKLASRSIIEDPSFQGAHESQFVQIADLVAHATYQHLAHLEAKRFTWPWFPNYLSELHVGGGPQAI